MRLRFLLCGGHAVNWWIKLAPDVLAKLKGILMYN